MHRQLRYSPRRRRARVLETRFGIAAAVVLALVFVFMLAFVLPRRILPAVRAEMADPAADAAAPLAAEPVLTTEDDAPRLSDAVAGTVALVDVADVQVLADPSVNGDTILFAAGAEADSFDRLVRYDTVTGEAEGVLVPMRFDTLRNPVEDDARIVYVDAKRTGGGAIRALDKATGETHLICEIASDIPVLFYETPYLVWKERTPAGAAKLYACHLGTDASVTLALLDAAMAAESLPSLAAGEVLYAEPEPGNGSNGVIRSVQLADGETDGYAPGMYVQDPKRRADVLAWTNGRHGGDNDLYCRIGGGEPMRLAGGVIDYYLAERVVAYGLDRAVYAYECATSETYRLSGEGENAQLAAAGGSVAVWRSMQNPDSPVWKYMRMD